MPYHFAVRSLYRTPLVEDVAECRALWDALVARIDGITALAIMPDHVHVLSASPNPGPVATACRAFARWRNARRDETGPVFRPIDPPTESEHDKIRRDTRYVHMNPVRALLASDPLAWPFSAYRDAVDLAPWPVRKPAAGIPELHRYVSSDPKCNVSGSTLPSGLQRPPTLEHVATAVTSLGRGDLVTERGPVRRLFVQAARCLTDATLAEIAAVAELSLNAAQRVEAVRDHAVDVVTRVAGDARFRVLPQGNLWELPEWRRYADLRGIRLRRRG